MASKKEIPNNVEASLETRKETTKQKKQRFIKAFALRLCNVSKTCAVVGISRQTYYSWLDKDDAFKKEIEDAQETFFDDLETTMFNKAVMEQDTTMLIWLSKTKMKHRGYIEKVENDVTVNPFMELMKSASVEEKKDK